MPKDSTTNFLKSINKSWSRMLHLSCKGPGVVVGWGDVSTEASQLARRNDTLMTSTVNSVNFVASRFSFC